MPAPMFFFPGLVENKPATFNAVGLSGLLRDGEPGANWFDCANAYPGSPDKPNGAFACIMPTMESAPIPLGYSPDKQEWTPCPGDKAKGVEPGRYWMGREKARPVTPKDLQRAKTLPGSEPLTLSDGQEWLLPIGLRLPHVFCLDADGEMGRKPQAKFAAIYERCQAASEFRWSNDLPWMQACEFVAEMLAHNYRVTKEICFWLGLFGTDSAIAAYDHCSGDTLRREAQKKIEAEEAAKTPVTTT